MILLIFAVLLSHSCSKDSDLFAEYVDEEIMNNIIEENDTLVNEEDKTNLQIEIFDPIQDAFLDGTSSFNEPIVRIDGTRRVSYLMFDLSKMSDTITNARFSFTIANDEGDGLVEIYSGTNNDWTEENLTQENAPKLDVLLGSSNKKYSKGSTDFIDLDITKIKPGLISIILVQKSGNDFAFASKENSSIAIPSFEVNYDENSNIVPNPDSTADTDNDGIIDVEDNCPTVPGTSALKGCPESSGGNQDCYDPAYPVINEFMKAGVVGGIPNNLPIVKTINPTDNLQSAINNANANGGGVIQLNSGIYNIKTTIYMKSNVVLRGVNRSTVVLNCTMRADDNNKKDAIIFENVTYSGIENLTYNYDVPGCEPSDLISDISPTWGEVFKNDPCGKKDLYVTSIYIKSSSSNCWIKNTNVNKSGWHTIRLAGNHNEVSNSNISRAYNKGGSGRGYFDITGDYNLIKDNKIEHIRHLSIHLGAEYNVIFRNIMNVNLDYHDADDGNNLAELNILNVPDYSFYKGKSILTGDEGKHSVPGPNNIMYNNDSSGSNIPLANDAGVVYTFGPGYNNIIDSGKAEPNCKTFYPID